MTATQAYPIAEKSDFRAWALQHTNAAKLLKEIIFRWRGSTIKTRGSRGPWTVYHVDQWAEWTGLSRDQTKRALRVLEIDGLISRERHKFTGKGVWLYLQPTRKALTLGSNRPQDLARLGDDPSSADAPDEAPNVAPVSAPISAPISPPIHTLPFPSSPTGSSSSTILQASPDLSEEGKGMAGGKGKATKKLEIASSSTKTLTPQSASLQQTDDQDAIDAMFAALKAKKLAKLEKAYPILKGKHEKHVKHPAKLHDNWAGFSPGLQAKLYAKYEAYVANWYKGKKGKPYAEEEEWTAEEDAAFFAAMAAL